jgi:hypothetical protein
VSWKRLGIILIVFIGGYGSVAAVGQDPSALTFDWDAIRAGLIAAGLAQPALSTASPITQIVSTICAFIFGYGTIESSIGFRYAIGFDWRAVIFGLSAAGLIHTNNQNVVQPIAQAIAKPAPEKP